MNQALLREFGLSKTKEEVHPTSMRAGHSQKREYSGQNSVWLSFMYHPLLILKWGLDHPMENLIKFLHEVHKQGSENCSVYMFRDLTMHPFPWALAMAYLSVSVLLVYDCLLPFFSLQSADSLQFSLPVSDLTSLRVTTHWKRTKLKIWNISYCLTYCSCHC